MTEPPARLSAAERRELLAAVALALREFRPMTHSLERQEALRRLAGAIPGRWRAELAAALAEMEARRP